MDDRAKSLIHIALADTGTSVPLESLRLYRETVP
jgi:hypothetical protein